MGKFSTGFSFIDPSGFIILSLFPYPNREIELCEYLFFFPIMVSLYFLIAVKS